MSHFHPDPATFLEELVKIPSVSGSEGAAAAWLVSRMSDLRYDEAFVDGAGSPTGILGQGEKTLILLGHIDPVAVVHPQVFQGCLTQGFVVSGRNH